MITHRLIIRLHLRMYNIMSTCTGINNGYYTVLIIILTLLPIAHACIEL